MAEFSSNAAQTVAASSSVLFTETPVPSQSGLIFHREGSGVFRLAGPSRIGCNGFGFNLGCSCCNTFPEALYLVSFHANIAIPTDGTVGPISLAVAIDGDVDPSSTMIFTPAAVNEYGNVGAEIIVAVPFICGCESISIRNTSGIDILVQDILVQNANLVITYQGIMS